VTISLRRKSGTYFAEGGVGMEGRTEGLEGKEVKLSLCITI
jgi:hypothetical protein